MNESAGMGSPARMVVIEPNPEGHRLWYVARLVADARQLSGQVRLVTAADSRDQAEWAHLADSCADHALLPRGRERGVEPWLAEVGPSEYAIVPDGDLWLRSAAWCAPPGHGGAILVMRPTSSGLVGWVKYWGKGLLAALSRCRGWRVSVLVPFGLARGRAIHPALRWLPRVSDPLPLAHGERMRFRRKYRIPDDAIVALCAGVIDLRKSPLQLARWAMGSELENLRVVLLGKMDPNVESQLENYSTHRLRCEPGFLSEQELGDAYAGCDAVMALYVNQGSSGAVAYALAHAKPVVAWGSKLVRDVVTELGIGVVSGSRDAKSLDQALVRALQQYAPMPVEERVTVPPGGFLGEIVGLHRVRA